MGMSDYILDGRKSFTIMLLRYNLRRHHVDIRANYFILGECSKGKEWNLVDQLLDPCKT